MMYLSHTHIHPPQQVPPPFNPLYHVYSLPPRSLLPSSVLNLLIGRAILDNHKAKFVLAHKLILIRVPSSPHAAHNLLGYLVSDGTGRGLVGKSLQSVLEVWSDSTSLRHMDRRQHAWISRVLVLGVNLLRGHEEFKDFEQGSCVQSLLVVLLLLLLLLLLFCLCHVLEKNSY